MRLLLVFSMLATQQTALGQGLLTKSTKRLLKTGFLVKLELPVATSPEGDNMIRRVALREINVLPERKKKAREIVVAEHGFEDVIRLDRMLIVQQAADDLNIENLNLKKVIEILEAYLDRKQ